MTDHRREVQEAIAIAQDKAEAARVRAAAHEEDRLHRIQQKLNALDMSPEEMFGMPMPNLPRQPQRQPIQEYLDPFAQDDFSGFGDPGLVQRQPRQNLTEQMPDFGDFLAEEEAPKRSAPKPAATWSAKRFIAETKGGANIPVWKIVSSAGFSQEKIYRVEGVALKIAALLNESGNMNDPRVVKVIADYDKRDRILKEIRTLEKEAAGKPMKQERLRLLRGELTTLDYKLGI